jgi:hypothetical protein
MDGAGAGGLSTAAHAGRRRGHVGGRGACSAASARAGVKRALVQILVEVANIQTRPLKTEVEKGLT